MAVGPKELAIILIIGLLVFGAKKLRSIGSDLGSAVGEFKKGLSSEHASPDDRPLEEQRKG